MPLLRDLAEFFESIFMSSNPEVKKRQALRRIEGDLKNYRPVVYSNGLVSANFAEAVRILYVNTKVIDEILSSTICSDDRTRNTRFQEQLIMTGFSPEAQEILESLSYENRKMGAREAQSQRAYFESERRELEKVIHQMNTPDFVKIDQVIDKLKQLFDIGRYGYISTLRLFDVGFSSAPNYKPNFQAIPPDLLETALMDLYYVIADCDITMSAGQAIVALCELQNGGEIPEERRKQIFDSLRKIQSVRKQFFTNDMLEKLIALAKKNPDVVPPKSVYKSNARQNYVNYLEEKFIVDENRLKSEIQDETIASEVRNLFGTSPLAYVEGYNNEINLLLRQSTPAAFEFVTAYQLLKTFVSTYYVDHVKPLLNDIVIEGFFNNPAYKTEFSTIVYAMNDAMDRMEKFEHLFDRNAPFDEALVTGLIRDSHKDSDFTNKLKELVDKINKAARSLIQDEVTDINQMNKLIDEVLVDSKKPNSDAIGNLKVLMMSSRHRDNSEYLERQHPSWRIFLDIMKNYVIIGNIEKK